jgi:hypothetical protein
MEVEIHLYKRYPKLSEIRKWDGRDMVKKTLMVPKIARRSGDNKDLMSVLLISEDPEIFSNPKLYKNIPACGKFGINVITMSFFLDANCVFEEGFRWAVDEMKIDLSQHQSDRNISVQNFASADPDVKNWIEKNIHIDNYTVDFGFGLHDIILNIDEHFPLPPNF